MRRAASTTWYPSPASRSAVAAPIPLLAPVTTAIRCMGAFCQYLAVPLRETVHSLFAVPAASSLSIGIVAEPSADLCAVIFDWGGVITSPIVATVTAWLEAERIDPWEVHHV